MPILQEGKQRLSALVKVTQARRCLNWDSNPKAQPGSKARVFMPALSARDDIL
jgi:hypothetical protein